MDGYIGEVKVFAGNFAPRNWALCNGALLSINSNQALFSIVGTTYGGDGRTTFALPDLKGRAAISAGQGAGLSDYSLGQKVGSESVAITPNEMAEHTHTAAATVNASKSTGNNSVPTGKVMSASSEGDTIYGDTQDTTLASGAVGVVNANTGGGQGHENRPPSLAMNWIICVQGIFPSRT